MSRTTAGARRRAGKRPLGFDRVWWVVVLLLAVGASPAAARDVQQLEAVGAVGLGPQLAGSPRDAAVREALREAVRRTARDLVAGDGSAAPSDVALDELLGSDPYRFATGFQVVEDRGEGPALFVSDPGFASEYVVVVNASIDRDRVRERLAAGGLPLLPSGDSPRFRIRLDLEEIDDYAAYQEIRRALIGELGQRSAIPVAAEPRRLALEVEADRPPSELLRPLQRAVAPRLALIPLAVGADGMSLRVVVQPDAAGKIDSSSVPPIDTSSPNRY